METSGYILTKKNCATRVIKYQKILPKEIVQCFAGSVQVPNVLSLLKALV